MLLECAPNDPKEHGEVSARIESVIETLQPAGVFLWVKGRNGASRIRTEIRQRILDRPKNDLHVPIGKRRRN
jgi:hypothetical protein